MPFITVADVAISGNEWVHAPIAPVGGPMMIRNARYEESQAIPAVYAAARADMARNGNPAQWAQGYPDRAPLKEDRRKGRHRAMPSLLPSTSGEPAHRYPRRQPCPAVLSRKARLSKIVAYWVAIKSFSQPERQMKSAFLPCEKPSRKG